jgi:hypothetical protein
MEKHFFFLNLAQHHAFFIGVPIDTVGCNGNAGGRQNQSQSQKPDPTQKV